MQNRSTRFTGETMCNVCGAMCYYDNSNFKYAAKSGGCKTGGLLDSHAEDLNVSFLTS